MVRDIAHVYLMPRKLYALKDNLINLLKLYMYTVLLEFFTPLQGKHVPGIEGAVKIAKPKRYRLINSGYLLEAASLLLILCV